MIAASFPIFYFAKNPAVVLDDANTCTEYATVAQVGGCDSHGLCGVRTNYGEKIELKRPVAGETVCISHRGYLKALFRPR